MADVLMDAAGAFTNPMTRDDDDVDAADGTDGQSAGLSKRQLRRLREDSNSVVCPDYFAWARKLLSNPETGEPTALSRVLPYLAVVRPLSLMFYASGRLTSATEPTETDVLMMTCYLCFFVMGQALTLICTELRYVLRKDGELESLGIGTTKISARAFASLEQQRKLLRFFQLALVGNGLGWGAGGIGSLIKNAYENQFLPGGFTRWGFNMVPVALFFLIEAPLFIELALTMQVASALGSDAVLEVVHAVRKTAPSEADTWESEVVAPALALANGSVGLLSQGWSKPLALAFFGMWTMAIGVFAMMLYMLHIWPTGSLVFSAALLGCLLMPLIMSAAVADVSTSCDDLLASINERRIEDLERGALLFQLETALKNLNNGQGLGFVVFENVLDKKRLRQIFLGIFGVFSTLVPLMLAFNSEGQDAVHYASFTNRPEIYAFNPTTRSYPESIAFCANHWMRPAVFRSAKELAAMHAITHGKQAFIGAKRVAFNDGETPTDYDWETRTSCVGSSCTGTDASWWVPRDRIDDFHEAGEYMYVETSDDPAQEGRIHGVRFDATASSKGILCMASSVGAMKGVLPPIQNLGDSPVSAVSTCGLQMFASWHKS